MLDIRFIQENVHAVKTNIANRHMKADPVALLSLYEERNKVITALDALRAKRNENAGKIKGPIDPAIRTALIDEGKALKEEIANLENTQATIEIQYREALETIPNMAHPDAPVGKLDSDNKTIKHWGEPTRFSFKPKDHVELGELLDILDFESGTKVSGTKFYFLKNEGVFLELGLVRYAMDILQKHGFTPVITPDIAKEEILKGIGFNPRGAESNIYALEETGTCLVGTAEITLGGMHAETTIEANELPIRYAGLSHCFRREAGAAGQFSKGLYRVHQFSKVEMFVYCLPEESETWHQKLKAIEEEIFQGLEIPYRIVDTCTGDLGAPAYRKYDIEAWMPGRGEGEYGEVTSTSNCTDYQARRLNIKYKKDNQKGFLHMLNGTAIAVSRGIIAVLENFQQADGSIRLPKALVPYCGFEVIKPRKTK
jgi:seryl-tRNA synthetase